MHINIQICVNIGGKYLWYENIKEEECIWKGTRRFCLDYQRKLLRLSSGVRFLRDGHVDDSFTLTLNRLKPPIY